MTYTVSYAVTGTPPDNFATLSAAIDAANTWARANRSFRATVTQDSDGAAVYLSFVRPEPPDDEHFSNVGVR
jgi:hypothetical protein